MDGKKRLNVNQTKEEFNDMAAMEKRWGVSTAELKKAIDEVGSDKAKIEEYLVNNKWKTTSDDEISFQKRDLNEEETY